MTAAALIALVVLMVGIPALVINRDLFRNRLGRSARTRSEPAPFLIFPLERYATGELADLPIPAWPVAPVSAAGKTATDATSNSTSERSTFVQPEPGLADVAGAVSDEDELDGAGQAPRGSWVESPPADFHWPMPPQRAD